MTKLVRRHPHVFADRAVDGAAEVAANWDEIKAAEKRRESVTDGVPLGQPGAGTGGEVAAPVPRRPASTSPRHRSTISAPGCSRWWGTRYDADVDPEAALRATARAYRAAVRAAEGASEGGGE